MTIAVARTISGLRAAAAAWRAAGERIALVPTMGALHAGHLSLVAEARARAGRVIASIFVNPLQFGPAEDLDRYPRQEAADAALLAAAGCDLLYAPTPAVMYPDGFATSVRVSGLGDMLCGAARPGHFDGVATVVTKLLVQAAPDVAVFGEKDWQQLAIIRRVAADLDLPVAIAGAGIVRDDDGLALSSRNAYLSPEQRRRAVALPSALRDAVAAIERGAAPDAVIARARDAVLAGGFDGVDYIELRGAADLARLDRLDRPARLLAAARIGGTRLIDNWPVMPRQERAERAAVVPV